MLHRKYTFPSETSMHMKNEILKNALEEQTNWSHNQISRHMCDMTQLDSRTLATFWLDKTKQIGKLNK